MANVIETVKVNSVIGPVGERLTLADLPAADTVRWTVRRKAEVVAAVEGGMLPAADAFALYNISAAEYALWIKSAAKAGLMGLRVTRLQHYGFHRD